MADHRPWRRRVIVVVVVQGLARALVRQPKSALFSITPAGWLLAMGSTASPMRRSPGTTRSRSCISAGVSAGAFVGLASFTTYALAHNIGASVFPARSCVTAPIRSRGSASARSACWSPSARSPSRSAQRVGGCSLLLSSPELVERFVAAPEWLGRAGRRSRCSRRRALYVAGSLLHFRPLKDRRLRTRLPAPADRSAAIAAGPFELIGAAGIIYFALPAAANPGFSSCSASSSPRSRSR